MIQLSFDPNANLLVFECEVEGQFKTRAFLALDSGASNVILSEEILEDAGYDLDAVTRHETFGDASQSHTVPVVTLTALSVGPARQEDLEALAYTIPEEHGLDGVIGLNYLRRFRRVTLDFEAGLLTLEPRRQTPPIAGPAL